MQGLARNHGFNTPCIDYYVNNRDEVLNRLSEITGEEKGTIKVALLAIVYGANLYYQGDIRELLSDGYDSFSSDEEVKALYKEVRDVGRFIINLEGQKTQREHFVNILDKSVPYIQQNFGSMLSHILQGYEAKIMHLVIEKHSEKISLLLHDGYIFKEEIDVREIEQDIKEQIGLDITMTIESC